LTVAALSGCGGSAKSHPVHGKVLVGDRPLPFGTITFNPDVSKDNKAGVGATGKLNSNGEFELQHQGKAEVPEGWYRVTVSTVIPSLSPPEGVEVPTLAADYSNVEKTPLLVEVVKDPGPDHYRIVIPEPPPGGR
jgi:hypothetical protein